MEELERDVALEIVVPGAEDLSHAPGAETAEDAVAAQYVTDRWRGVRFPVDAPILAHGAVEGKR
jgi:hypothetical protein